jgi:methyl-accepting chemotaxis protein
MKLKYRLSIIVIAILTAVVAAISVILLNHASTTQMSTARESQERFAAGQALKIQMRYEKYLAVIHTIANAMADFDTIDVGRQRNRFDQIMESILMSEPRMIAIYAVFKPNTIDPGMDAEFAGQAGNTGTGQWANWYTKRSGKIEHLTYDDISSVMSIMNGPRARGEVIYDPVPQTVAGKEVYTIKISVPVIHRQTNTVVGRVGVNVDISYLQPLVDEIIEENADITAMSVYSGNGTIIGTYAPEQIGKFLKDTQRGLYKEHTNLVQDTVVRGEKLLFSEYSDVLGKDIEIILYPFTIGETGVSWSLMLSTERDVILAEVKAMTVFTVIIAIIAVLFVAVIIFFVSASITKPIVHVTLRLKDISEGAGDLTQRLRINSKDEIGDLARYFNETLNKLKNLVLVIKKQSIILLDIGNELSSNMTETTAAINQITAHIQSIKAQVTNQATSVSETNATMEKITRSINKLSSQVDRQSDSVARSSSAIEEMLANIQSVTQTLIRNAVNVKDLQEASEEGRTGLQEVAADIQEIARESEGLLEINGVMENIASQTNLLSMNAAIEAAHAGEAGKGFAVVADEIRKLAESSGEQSQTIAKVLKKIKEAIDQIMISTDRVLKQFGAIDSGVRIVSQQEENIRNAMEEQGAGSKQILSAIGGLNEVTNMVQEGSSEMGEGSKQVIKESKQLERVSNEISNGMNEMASGAEQINVAVSRVNRISMENKENIEVLVKEVSRFKVE